MNSFQPEKRSFNAVVAEEDQCFGFMDMEYKPEHNPGRNPQQMVDDTLTYLVETWKTEFPSIEAPEKSDFLVLNSSDATKGVANFLPPLVKPLTNC